MRSWDQCVHVGLIVYEWPGADRQLAVDASRMHRCVRRGSGAKAVIGGGRSRPSHESIKNGGFAIHVYVKSCGKSLGTLRYYIVGDIQW